MALHCGPIANVFKLYQVKINICVEPAKKTPWLWRTVVSEKWINRASFFCLRNGVPQKGNHFRGQTKSYDG